MDFLNSDRKNVMCVFTANTQSTRATKTLFKHIYRLP